MDILLWLGVGITVAVWAAVFVSVRARKSPNAPPKRPEPKIAMSRFDKRNRLMVSLLIVIAWALGSVPNLIKVLQLGRSQVVVSAVQNSPLAQSVGQSLLILFVAVCAFIIIDNSNRHSPAASRKLFILMLPAAVLMVSHLLNGGRIGIEALFYPIGVFALWRARVTVSALSIVGVLTIVTVTFSVIFAQVQLEAATTLPPIIGGKTIWPTLLAGPYGHPNVLGLGLSLGSPFIFLLRSRILKAFGLVMVMIAITWSGNRNSIMAVLVGIAVYGLLILTKTSIRWIWTAFFAGVALVVVTPFLSDTADAFSNRGMIWQASLAEWRRLPLLGSGPNYYMDAARYWNDLGPTAFNGHNGLVHYLTTGGVLLVGAVAILLVAVLKASMKLEREECRVALSFIVLLVFNSWLQNTVIFYNLSELAFAGWITLTVIYLAPISQTPAVAEVSVVAIPAARSVLLKNHSQVSARTPWPVVRRTAVADRRPVR